MTTLIVACVLASTATFIVGRFVGTKIAQRDMPSRKRYIKFHRFFKFNRRPASDIELRAGHDVAVAVLAAFVVLGLALPSLGFWLPCS